MKVDKYDGGNERRAIIGLITSKRVIMALQPNITSRAFPSRWADLVASWCLDYYEKHHDAPGRAIESLFASWAVTREAQGDEETVVLVERFLGSLSQEYESEDRLDDNHVIEQASQVILKHRIRKLKDQLEGCLLMGELSKATDLIESFKKVSTVQSGFVEVLSDSATLQAASDYASEPPVIVYPGDAGVFYGRVFERDAFIAFMAPEKRGKSHHLIDAAWRAQRQRKRTLLFAAGDMTAKQMHRRFATRACRRPMLPRTIKYPISMVRVDNNSIDVQYESRSYDHSLTFDEAWRAYQEVKERYLYSDEPFLEMGCFSAGYLSVEMIRTECMRRADAGRPLDVAVIDYADLLAPPPGLREARDKVNAIWMGLRALSSELHLCLITATQADAKSYGKRNMTMENFSEDKRKLAHATAVIAINSTDEEKERGIQRLGYVVLREDDFAVSRQCHVAGCLAIADPIIKSCF